MRPSPRPGEPAPPFRPAGRPPRRGRRSHRSSVHRPGGGRGRDFVRRGRRSTTRRQSRAAGRVLDRPSKLLELIAQLVETSPVTPLAGVGTLADEAVNLRRRARDGHAPRKQAQRTAQTLDFVDSGHERLLSVSLVGPLDVLIQRACKIEESAERLRRIEVVVHRRLEAETERTQRIRDRPRRPCVAGGFPEQAAEALERTPRLVQALLRELDRMAVVGAEQPESQRVRIVALHQLADEQRVAQGFGHLLGAQIHEPVVDPVPSERLPGRRLRLCDLALVVGKDEVLAPAMDVERRAEILHRHGRALDVPAGASIPPGTRPRRLARLGRFPQREVTWVAFALVHVDAGAGEQLVEVLAGQPAVGRKPRDLEVDVTLDDVGDTGGDELLDEPGHLLDMVSGLGLDVAALHADRVQDDGAPGVPDVAEVVDRDPTHVHPHLAGHEWDEVLLLAGEGVVDAEAHVTSTPTTAMAAMPSLRPSRPRPSGLFAFTLTAPRSTPSVSASRLAISSRWGCRRGAWARTVASTFTSRPPRDRTRSMTFSSNTRLEMP